MQCARLNSGAGGLVCSPGKNTALAKIRPRGESLMD